MKRLGLFLLFAFFVAFGTKVSASYIASFSENFNSPTSGISYVGNAAQLPSCPGAVGSAGCLRLTPNVNSSRGSAWNTTSYNFRSFSTQFDFLIGPSSGGGADGFTFSVIDATTHNPNTALGGGGGGLGYLGLNNSFAVEFDTWNNGSIDGFNANHVGINQNGDINSLARQNLPFLLETTNANNWHTANISFDASGLLSVDIDGTNWLSHTLSGYSNNVYFGFTAATGAARDGHYIDNWSMSIDVPEPSIIALFAAGLFGLGFARRRKRG